jgi:hypothetical protein
MSLLSIYSICPQGNPRALSGEIAVRRFAGFPPRKADAHSTLTHRAIPRLPQGTEAQPALTPALCYATLSVSPRLRKLTLSSVESACKTLNIVLTTSFFQSHARRLTPRSSAKIPCIREPSKRLQVRRNAWKSGKSRRRLEPATTPTTGAQGCIKSDSFETVKDSFLKL